MSYVFLRKERVCEETNQLSCCCYTVLDIAEETLSGNHGTEQHLPPDKRCLPHQQTIGLLFYMHQIGTENYGWLPSDLLVEAQDNEKEATRCCCNNHCNIAGQFLHQGTRGCTSAIKWSEVRKKENYVLMCVQALMGR